MSKKSTASTTKATNNYINLKIIDEYCISMCNLVKNIEGKTYQEIATEALNKYFNEEYVLKKRGKENEQLRI